MIEEVRQRENRIPFVDTNQNIGELKPLANMVFVEPDLPKDEITGSGLHIAKPKKFDVPNKGKVLAVGEGVVGLKVGDMVIFSDLQARGFWNRGQAHIPLKQEQIIGIFREAKA